MDARKRLIFALVFVVVVVCLIAWVQRHNSRFDSHSTSDSGWVGSGGDSGSGGGTVASDDDDDGGSGAADDGDGGDGGGGGGDD